MKFFQKRSVAVITMVLAMVVAVVIGQARKPDTGIPPQTNVIGSYTYVRDYSGVIQKDTVEYINAMNTSLFAQTGGQILVQVVDSTGGVDMERYAIDLGNQYQVGDAERDNGLILLLARENISYGGLVGDYWVEPGDGIYAYVDELDAMCRLYLEDVAAADIPSLVETLNLETPETQLVFLTDLLDTRFTAYGVLRPLEIS